MPGWLQSIWEPSARSVVKRINTFESPIQSLSDEQLRAKTDDFKLRLQQGGSITDLIPEAFAVVREASRRSIGLRHFDVQLLGGVELARGRIIEMRTGEGKTLVATLPAYLHALAGKGVHVVTVNDYLAERDAFWMGPVYEFLGMSVGCIQENMGDGNQSDTQARKSAYACDITYGTNHEIVFDYLRDNLAPSLEETVHRDLHYAIVDEVDLLLIDEAQTPLIISGQAQDDPSFFKAMDRVMRTLNPEIHFKADRRTRTASLTEEGLTEVENALGVGSLSKPENLRWMHATHQSLQAHAIFELDVDYIVQDGEVLLVDEHTGRVSEDKRFSDGLHQALEAKEGVTIKSEDITLAKTSYQHFFRSYYGLSGMTGTAWSERDEFQKIYSRKVVRIPTHRRMIRKDYDNILFTTLQAKHKAVVEEIKELQSKGLPVLVGTVSVRESEQISRILKKSGIQHEVLNAKHHKREAEIIAQAGRAGAVTISTNMAGRGTDILLGGNPKLRAKALAEEGSERYQRSLQRFEQEAEQQQQRIIEAGGLQVIGTGLHESVRIDNQLRGRAGRQGDPGSTIYFISIEDPVYRAFGQQKILEELQQYLADHPQDEPVDNAKIRTALEALRSKVEVENQAIRLEVFKYDSVIHDRRETIWQWRRSLLHSDKLESWQKQSEELIEELIDQLEQETRTRLSEDNEIAKNELENSIWNAVRERIFGVATVAGTDDIPDNSDEFRLWFKELYEQRYGTDLDELLVKWERGVLLQTVDRLWTQFLTDSERVEEGVGLRSYSNLDPLVEFRREIGLMFQQLMLDIRLHAIRSWMAVDPKKAVEQPQQDPGAPLQPIQRNDARTPRKTQRAIDRLPKIGRGGRRKRKR